MAWYGRFESGAKKERRTSESGGAHTIPNRAGAAPESRPLNVTRCVAAAFVAAPSTMSSTASPSIGRRSYQIGTQLRVAAN
jgi:hypothetical protein